MRRRAAAVLLMLGTCAGCARELQAPERTGTACDSDADCNHAERDADASACGFLRLCVAGRCELDAGVTGRPIVCGGR